MPPITISPPQRLDRLLSLWQRWRLQAIATGAPATEKAFAAHVGLAPSQLSQHKGGKPLGDRLCRRIEAACGVPAGWMDDAAASPPMMPTLAATPSPAVRPLRGMLELLGPESVPAAMLQAFGPGAALAMPQVEHSTPAGFPSPAADFETSRVDLVEQMGLNQPTTFLARVRGLSMIGKGIDDGDLLVINKAIEPRHGHIVVAVVDNELTCKTLHKQGPVVRLEAANPDFPDIVPKEGQTLTIWGVVTSVIKQMSV
jgi:DNA polymerase V